MNSYGNAPQNPERNRRVERFAGEFLCEHSMSPPQPMPGRHGRKQAEPRQVSEALNIPLCIHMDPIVTGDEASDAVMAHLAAFLAKKEGGFMLHDLRMVPGENRTNLVFDVVIPAGFEDTKTLTAELCAAAKEIDPRYECVIHFDIDFYH